MMSPLCAKQDTIAMWLSQMLIRELYYNFMMSENIINFPQSNFLLCTMIYLSYVNLTIQLPQFDEYPT